MTLGFGHLQGIKDKAFETGKQEEMKREQVMVREVIQKRKVIKIVDLKYTL